MGRFGHDPKESDEVYDQFAVVEHLLDAIHPENGKMNEGAAVDYVEYYSHYPSSTMDDELDRLGLVSACLDIGLNLRLNTLLRSHSRAMIMIYVLTRDTVNHPSISFLQKEADRLITLITKFKGMDNQFKEK